MRLDAECYPCMMSQAFRAARLSGLKDDALQDAMDETAAILKDVDPTTNPPAAAVSFYDRIKDLSGVEDPFLELKHKSNEKALAILPRLREDIESSSDPLSFALRAAVAGNIIDFGALAAPVDLEENLQKVLEDEPFIDHTEQLRDDLAGASSALIICDNAGEIVMDRLLCEVLSSLYPSLDITAAVRGGPAINDATLEDAKEADLDLVCPVITTGLAMAGIDLERCSPRFQEAFRTADVILAKGQGNFETMDKRKENIYFLFQVKCDCVSKALGTEKGSAVIWSLNRG
jgi:uncharacterized protein with ATP-grasp and redox domains